MINSVVFGVRAAGEVTYSHLLTTRIEADPTNHGEGITTHHSMAYANQIMMFCEVRQFINDIHQIFPG